MLYSQVVPNNVQLILTIIGEELKSCKFFSALRALGLDDAFYQTNLCSLILAKAGFEEETNELLDQYFNLLSCHSKELEATDASVRNCAFQFYMELVTLKK